MILLTTPTGQIGSRVLHDVLAATSEPVRLIVRDPARLDPALADRVDVVAGSHGEAAVVGPALDDVDAVFWLVPPMPGAATLDDAYAGFTRPFAAALPGSGVSHVVNVSALGRGTPVAGRAGYVTASLAVDDLLASSAPNFRALAMPSFMDNLLRQVVPIRDRGVWFDTADGDVAAPTCAVRDIAAAATDLLTDRSWSGSGERAVLGPEDLSPHRMAATMSEVLGRPVRYQRIPTSALAEQMTRRGLSPAMVQGMVEMMEAKDAGLDTRVPRTAGSTTPTTFRRWCEEVLRPALRPAGPRAVRR